MFDAGDHKIRDLTPSAGDENPTWKVVGLELAHNCTFCGAPSEATVGCPDEHAPFIFQVGVCNHCLVDMVMQRFTHVKHQRVARLAYDTTRAENEIEDARARFRHERFERGGGYYRLPLDPEVEAAEAKKLAAEEEAIARKYDMCPGWTYAAAVAGKPEALRAMRERKRRKLPPLCGQETVDMLRDLMAKPRPR